MDIETEKVIDLVFPDGLPESWKNNPDFYQYLSKLGGFDVEQLNKEPEHLTDDKNSVVLQTQELAFSNYKTFIRTAESSREIFTRKRKRKSLTIQQKMEILSKLEKGTKNKKICEEYQVNSSTVSTIFKHKDDITKFYSELENNQDDPKKRKINNGAELKILDEAVYLWLRQESALGKSVSGILLQEKARNLFIILKEKGKIPNESSDFKASSGWLRNFYHRHGIRNSQVKGEKASADKDANDAFIEEFRQLLVDKQYSLDDVYNADETGLLYRCLPNRTLVLSDAKKKVAGHKPMKDRLTVMVCANASGSHKIPPFVIGKSKTPRCFKNKTIPLVYTAQRKACMDSNGFWFWYRNIFLKNVRDIKPNAKIILLLDDAPTHPTAQELNLEHENSKVLYLPPRVTSLVQPMDQGVISAMKRHYQTAFVQELLSHQLENRLAVLKFVHTWDVLSCIRLLKEAWDSLTVNTLRNAWNKLLPIPESDSIEEDSPTNSEIAQLLNCVSKGNAISLNEVNDWLNADQHLPVFEELNDEQIVQSVIGHPQSTENNEAFEAEEDSLDSNITEDENEEEPKEQTTPQHVLSAAQCTLSYGREKMHLSGSELSTLLKFNETEKYLDNLIEKLPEFGQRCQSFCDASKDINTHRRLNGLTLTRNAELLEILEMPQLMESCLRSNQYNEALELSQYARQLGAKHGDIPIISSIVAEIENSWSGMVSQVVGSLRGDLPLPRCLQLVGLLRSMDAFTEPELRVKFLQARDSWLQGLLNAISKEDPNQHLTKTIELSRIHLFNIITQYRAIFNDDDHLTSSRDIVINESAIFHHWLEEKIHQFLTTLEQDLPGVTSIDSVLGQCTYFGLSFSRVGADFTARMSHIFICAIGNKFETTVRRTTRKFEKDMETFTLINKLQRADVKNEKSERSENPPEQLVEFFPLAEYCNGLISAFNELRLCAPVALADTCTHLLQDSLQSVAKAMLIFYKQEQQAFTAAERDNMITFAESLSEQLVPYVQYCIHAIFPSSQVASHLGITVNQLQKEGTTYLDHKNITQPLAPLLPVRLVSTDPVLSPVTVSAPVSEALPKESLPDKDLVAPESDDKEPKVVAPDIEAIKVNNDTDLNSGDIRINEDDKPGNEN